MLSATAERYDELRSTLYAIMDGTRANPAWDAAINQVGQTNAAQFAAHQGQHAVGCVPGRAGGHRCGGSGGRRPAKHPGRHAQQAFDAIMAPPPVAYGSPGVSAQEACRNELGRVTAVGDPNSSEGNIKYVSSSTAVTWQNEKGGVIETDDVNLDPNINSSTTWKVVCRYGNSQQIGARRVVLDTIRSIDLLVQAQTSTGAIPANAGHPEVASAATSATASTAAASGSCSPPAVD